MNEAVCIRCGAWKRRPASACRRCGFAPALDAEALVQSVYLSTGRFEAPAQQDAYREVLQQVARDIAAGSPPGFDPAELERLRAQRDLVRSVPASAVYGALARLFLPAALFLGGMYALLLLLRWWRG